VFAQALNMRYADVQTLNVKFIVIGIAHSRAVSRGTIS